MKSMSYIYKMWSKEAMDVATTFEVGGGENGC